MDTWIYSNFLSKKENRVVIYTSTSPVKFCMGGRLCSLDQTHSECQSTLVEIMPFVPEIE